jgi:uncharacterized protein YndB with AHSA1/START domain
MATSTTNEIVQQVVLHVPVERVWRAISDSSEFGAWFGMTCGRSFERGAEVPCEITSEGEYRGTEFAIWIEEVRPPSLLSFRWHPGAPAPDGYSSEPTTLVSFALEPHPEGTHLTIVESGFDDIPLERRAEAFSGNSEGWRLQTEAIAAYLASHA